jgi:ribonuclease P protein subunit POP4
MKARSYEDKMMIISPSIVQHEFIGLQTKVVDSTHSDYVGILGEVINETRNTLTIYSGEEKIIVKGVSVFHFYIGNTIVQIDGRNLIGKPEDRIKKRIRKLW